MHGKKLITILIKYIRNELDKEVKYLMGKISWRWPAPYQTFWFPVLALTIRPGLGLARTVTFFYDQPLGSGWPATSQRLVSHEFAAG